ncbi:2-C-methyl-D-erythritol 4-phosphate cytidylyltransferase [Gallaecimonas kandeliae]|uniref:2-C-methyl-D-erythritol 4-phosphate cytidylyltransferase n=1 Tax=Gallaecimonas kandeliae TaxID=3029055 RepID=UPI002647D450|nr:2-C-methyl-D-erythritol 4-phosphate cytidylyltransferase [Gallaecimonas kandeliae]WKE66449.1 2-C-methyl-D-erythritol 4-phosphate cytidylyltransferase [Gallaecimonas kandeliae]
MTDKLVALVPAAGIGRRMGGDKPKQYLTLTDKSILGETLSRLLAMETVSEVVVALAEDDPYFFAMAESHHPRLRTVVGGEERADSVLACLNAVNPDIAPWVLVHDAARPLITEGDVQALVKAAKAGQGAILAAPLVDTVKWSGDGRSIEETVPRQHLWRALTPQCFPTALLRQALAEALMEGAAITDEASAMERLGLKVALVKGRADNIKITEPADLPLARWLLSQQEIS